MNEKQRQLLIDELNGLGSGDIERDHLDADTSSSRLLLSPDIRISPTHGYRHANALDSGTPERRRNGSH